MAMAQAKAAGVQTAPAIVKPFAQKKGTRLRHKRKGKPHLYCQVCLIFLRICPLSLSLSLLSLSLFSLSLSLSLSDCRRPVSCCNNFSCVFLSLSSAFAVWCTSGPNRKLPKKKKVVKRVGGKKGGKKSKDGTGSLRKKRSGIVRTSLC